MAPWARESENASEVAARLMLRSGYRRKVSVELAIRPTMRIAERSDHAPAVKICRKIMLFFEALMARAGVRADVT
jgi:hypothetical protein